MRRNLLRPCLAAKTLLSWAPTRMAAYLKEYPAGQRDPIFTNEAGNPLSRTLFRSRVWRPSLVRAGLLGEVSEVDGKFEAVWMDDEGDVHAEVFAKHGQAVNHVARSEHGGLRFHDLRHSYGTWLADDGIPPHRVAKLMGHEHITTTMQLYVRRTDDHDSIRGLLGDDTES
ncbi:tyrosine-type recombinase/integrase [Nocardia stercoris]|nr:tyrosine-type recombinase/integrase [Nocardia stercoris]